MADVNHDTEAEKTASAAEIVGSIDDLLIEIIQRVPSENIDRNNPLFKLASEQLNTLASNFIPLFRLLEIFRRVPSKKKGRKNYPLFKLASKHLNAQASYYCPLGRLKLVSRRWNSLISNNLMLPKPFPAAGLIFECGPTPRFTTKSHSSCIIFLDKSISTAPFREINPADDPWDDSRSKVIHSCNGLLLCAAKRKWAPHVFSVVYSVCNPTTGKHSTLPQVPGVNVQIIRGVYLAFDPCKSPHYKVVCVLGLEDENWYFQFVVYSSETGCWGKGGELFKTKNVRCFGNNNNNNGVFWNGAIHWVGSSQLICFNPNEDQLAPPEVLMPMPIALDHQYYFGESYGHLHYIGLDGGMREVVVHELSSDYSAWWVVKFKVDVSLAVGSSSFDLYAVVRGERDEDMFLVLGTSSWRGAKKKIVRFNHRDNTCEIIYEFNDTGNHLENPEKFTYPFQYIESLASV